MEQVREKIEELKSKEMQPELREVVDLMEMFISSFETIGAQTSGESQVVLRAIDIMGQTMDKRFEAMNERFIAVQREISALREEMNARFEALQGEMNARFEAMNDRFRTLMWWIPMWFTIFTGVFTAIFTTLLKLFHG